MNGFWPRLLVKSAAFFLLWIVLSGRHGPFHLTLGVLVSAGVAWLNTDRGYQVLWGPWIRLPSYVAWLLGRITQSSLYVTYLILHPRLPINPEMIRHRVELPHKLAVALLGNSITLTPGTITAEATSHHVLVHALDRTSAEDLLSGRLDRRVARVFDGKGS